MGLVFTCLLNVLTFSFRNVFQLFAERSCLVVLSSTMAYSVSTEEFLQYEFDANEASALRIKQTAAGDVRTKAKSTTAKWRLSQTDHQTPDTAAAVSSDSPPVTESPSSNYSPVTEF